MVVLLTVWRAIVNVIVRSCARPDHRIARNHRAPSMRLESLVLPSTGKSLDSITNVKIASVRSVVEPVPMDW